VDSLSVSLTEDKEKARDKLINTETVMDYSDKSGRIETSLNDDSDDEIIVKTMSWPVDQAPSKDSKSLDYTDKDIKNLEVKGESDGSDDTDDVVTEKVVRSRMKFPSSSNCSSAPAESCLNNYNSSSCETHDLHHKPQTRTKTANHQDLSEGSNSSLQIISTSAKKKTSCHLS